MRMPIPSARSCAKNCANPAMSRAKICSLNSDRQKKSSNRLPALAAELVALKVDVIVAVYTPCALAAKQATRDIPIVAMSGCP